MKYGRIICNGVTKGNDKTEKRKMNIGDIFECMAIDNIYERMGVDKSEIIDCNQNQLDIYDGEYVVIPINFYYTSVTFSSRVLPVYLGLSLGGHHELTDSEYTMLRKFSPIGCRDERTLRRLLNKGIDAYLNGCIVATFPQRQQGLTSQDTVIFADAQRGIKDYIPSELLKKYRIIHHELYTALEELNVNRFNTYAEQILDIYRYEAKLVVTSRFHAAVVCLALGIPVILTMENNYYKYTWIQKYIPIYEPKDFDKIDWNPPIVTIPNDEKELMLDIACDRIQETYNKYYKMCTLSEKRETISIEKFNDIFYGSYALQYIEKEWAKDIEIKYAFWGATEVAVKLFEFISENYPNAKLCRVYDLFVKNEFLGIIPETPENITKDEKFFIFVTAQSAIETAKEKFEMIGRLERDYFLCERVFLTENDIVL